MERDSITGAARGEVAIMALCFGRHGIVRSEKFVLDAIRIPMWDSCGIARGSP